MVVERKKSLNVKIHDESNSGLDQGLPHCNFELYDDRYHHDLNRFYALNIPIYHRAHVQQN